LNSGLSTLKAAIVLAALGILLYLPTPGNAQTYAGTPLVSDVPALAPHTDSNLVNCWGIAAGPTTPWWVANNGTGTSTLYDAAGNPQSLIVTIPPAPGGTSPAPVTGTVYNGTQDFQVASGLPALFLFVTEQGTISGWNSSANATNAINVVDRSANGANYKGVTLGAINGANVLYAADFHNNNVDVFNGSFQPVVLSTTAFKDPQLPSNFAPFNVQNVNGAIVVAFAQQDADAEDEVAGAGLGAVDIFSPAGVLVGRLEHGPWMNAPWGITFAPPTFGPFGSHFIIGNFGSGTLMAFDTNGHFSGFLRNANLMPVTIRGLWGISFGNGSAAGAKNVLYFAAGVADENHGLFGAISAAQ
jgi:uncharacterized protein (TIGR03118 family)